MAKQQLDIQETLIKYTIKWQMRYKAWQVDDTQQRYNTYDDIGKGVKALVAGILEGHSIAVKCDSFDHVIEPTSTEIGWDNGHWFHWIDVDGCRFRVDWLAIENIEIIEPT